MPQYRFAPAEPLTNAQITELIGSIITFVPQELYDYAVAIWPWIEPMFTLIPDPEPDPPVE